jgi:hypothetical protein
MAERVKRTWRGQTYYVKSSRPGKKRVRVKGHCRRKPKSMAARFFGSSDMPF